MLKRSIINIRPNIISHQRRGLLTISQSLDEAYKKHKIIPDVVDKFDTQGLLIIDYCKDHKVTLGNTLSIEQTQEKPKIQFTLNSPNQDGTVENLNKDDKFILVLTDPDAPSNTDNKWSQYLHWLITDLKLEQSKKDSSNYTLIYNQGKEIFKYSGPAPPPNTGPHRYVYLLYKQDPNAKLQNPLDRPNWGTGIPKFGVRDWINKFGNDSKLFGVNFFYAESKE